MAKTGYKIDYVVRDIGSDLSDLLIIHQRVFPNNLLATWKTDKNIIIKVSNIGEVTGKSLTNCKTEINYIEPIMING